MPNTGYHREIDGLRAIAVLVIVFFHLKLPGFTGGFIGVDVFFVVSGFLITRIIVAGLETGQFSFREFYTRRVTRIIPALACTVGAVMLCALYLQQPQALEHTAQQSIYALLSVSNLFFWSEANYWAPSAESFALLHTWSLGVEEQFYLVYPLMLVAAHRLGGLRGVVILLLLTLFAGVYASEVAARSHPEAAFYFTPLRFYEFALGGLGTVLEARLQWLRKSPWLSGAVTLSGVFLIVVSAVYFNRLMPLPGLLMLAPLSGTLLIIMAGSSPIAQLVLSNPVMSWVGKVSYSLYLVHWPIIVFYRQDYNAHPAYWQLAILLAAILVAAELLNRLVERRFRLSRDGNLTVGGMPTRSALGYTAAAVLLITLVAGASIVTGGWPGRLPAAAQELMAIDVRVDRKARKRYLEENCTPAGDVFCGERIPGKRTILLLADSRGTDLYIALREAYPEANVMVAYAAGCPPTFARTLGERRFFDECPEFNQARLQAALDAPADDVIFLAAELAVQREQALLDTVRRLRAAGKTVFLLGEFSIISNTNPIDIAIGSLRFGDDNYLERFLVAEPFRLDGEYADKVNALGGVYVSNKPLFYDGQYHLQDRETGELLTEDGIHLSTFGAKKFGQYLRAKYPLPKMQ